MPAGPGPLEIVAAEPAGHIDDFADEIEARHTPRLHRLRGELAGVDAADGHFRFRIAFGAVGANGQ